MRISDWSSDVCSSDLVEPGEVGGEEAEVGQVWPRHACEGELRGLPLADVQHPVRRRAVAVRAARHHADPLWLRARQQPEIAATAVGALEVVDRSEEHMSELQSLMRISYAVFCLKKKNKKSQYK